MKLLLLGFKVNLLEGVEFVRVLRRNCFNPRFTLGYLLLKLLYFFDSPYQVSKRYLFLKGADDVYVYGETPITLLQRLIDLLDIHSNETVFELGSGAGFTSLWLALGRGCQVTAIEQVPAFTRRLGRVIRWLNLKELKVIEGDYLEADLSGASVIYLYALDLSEADTVRLVQKLKGLPVGVKIITVSYPLKDYCGSGWNFKLLKTCTANFHWGKTTVYLQVRTSDELMSGDPQSGRYSGQSTPAPAAEGTDKCPV